MLRSIACALAVALPLTLSSVMASAEQIDASTVTCKELTDRSAAGKDEAYGASVLLYWMAGYHATDEQGTVVDFDNLVKGMTETADFCSKNPGISVLTASGKYMGTNAPAASPKAIDLSILKCEQVNSSKPDDAEGLGQILMWLSGYHKSTGGTTIVDLDEFNKSVDKMADFCTKNPAVGLYTASEKFMGEDGDSDDSSDNSESADDSAKE